VSLLDARLWLAVILIAVAAYTVGRWQQARLDKLEHQADLVEAVQQARAEDQRRVAAHQEIAHEATQKADLARADARAARAAAERLRRRVAELASGGASAPSGGLPTGDPIGVLADVLERADRRAGALAEYADSARIAGQACERAFDALIPKSP